MHSGTHFFFFFVERKVTASHKEQMSPGRISNMRQWSEPIKFYP